MSLPVTHEKVDVVGRLRLLHRPFRVVASPPYAISSALLRVLLGSRSGLVAADLVLQRAVSPRRPVARQGRPAVPAVGRPGRASPATSGVPSSTTGRLGCPGHPWPVSGRSGRVSLKINHVRQTRTVDGGSLQSLQESRRRPSAPRRVGRFGHGVLQLRDICQTQVVLLGHGDHDRLPAYR